MQGHEKRVRLVTEKRRARDPGKESAMTEHPWSSRSPSRSEAQVQLSTIDASLRASLARMSVDDLASLARRAHARGFESTLELIRGEFRVRHGGGRPRIAVA
jgi:hypothetical protein